MIPGEIRAIGDEIELNAGRNAFTLEVTNTGDRPIQVGSHYHMYETNAALELFGNKDAHGVVLLKPYGDYYGEYVDKVGDLLSLFPLGQQIVGESAQKEFIQLFGQILRLVNILSSFDDFAGAHLLTERQGQDYRSVYLDL